MRLSALVVVAVAVAATAEVRADDWEVKRSPFDPRLVERYRGMLRRDPDDEFAWKRLTGLYQNYRSLAELERDLAGRAARSHDFSDLLLWGHLARHRGDHAEAVIRYRAAVAARPGDVRGALALAGELRAEKHNAEAEPLYRSALSKLDAKSPQRRQVLRKLADIALDGGDVDAARTVFEQLIALDPSDVEVRRELAEALAQKGRSRDALAAYREIAPRLAGRPERAAEAWKRIGELAEASGDDVAALEAYRKGFAMLPRTNYLRRDITDKIIALYRRKDDLRSLLAVEEKTAASARGFIEWETLARLYDEVGDAAAATSAYRRALAIDRHALDARKRLIALLERAGHDDEVIAEYLRLIAEAPGEARFQLELAERYARSGSDGRKQAVALLARLSARFPGDPSVHGALAELYTRLGDIARAEREHELLARLEPDDAAHLVDLGEIYWQRGKRRAALDTWKKIESHGKDRASGMARLADVLGDHEMPGEAVELYERALKLKPRDYALGRGLAIALERVHRTAEAEQRWIEIYDQARDGKSRSLRLEARARLLNLAHKEGRLAGRLRDFRRRFEGPPPDDDWGLLLADASLKLGRIEDAELILQTIARRAATVEAKVEAQIGLAQVLKSRHKIKEAIAALERAAELSPSRARELYSQIAELSLSLYRDQDALAYANKAVALSPGDAQAEVRLAEIHEKREDDEGAIAAYLRALALDARLYRVDFALARLYLRKGAPAQAATLYRDVVLHAPEEDLVLDAARRAIDLEEYLGTLGDLQRTLTPLAYLHTQKPVYRLLLIELYDRYGTPLAARARHGDAAAARELKRLGEHGLKPLCEALVDGDPAEQRVAVGLLGDLGNPSAAAPLYRLALRGSSRDGRWEPSGGGAYAGVPVDIDTRVEAAFAAARLGDAASIPDLIKLAGEREKHLRIAALDGLGRLRDARRDGRATRALIHALDDSSPDAQAMACLGLARAGGADARTLTRLRGWISDGARPEAVRASAAIALGATGDAASVTALIDLLREGSDDPQRAAAWALGAIGDRRAEPALLAAMFTKREAVRRVAAEALGILSRAPGEARAGFEPDSGVAALAPQKEWGAVVDVSALVARLARPTGALATRPPFGGDGTRFAVAAAGALSDALGRHRDLQLRTLADLDGRKAGSGIGLGRLTAALDGLGDPERRAWERVLDDVGARIEPTLIALTRGGDALVAARAVALLARFSDPTAAAARVAALDERTIEVRLAALDAIGRDRGAVLANRAVATNGDAPVEIIRRTTALLGALLGARDWRERCAAADAVARLGPAASVDALASLTRLLDDANGYVREHAARAVGAAGAPAVAVLAAHLRDDTPEVRCAVADGLAATGSPAARAALAQLAHDVDPSVREAAAGHLSREKFGDPTDP